MRQRTRTDNKLVPAIPTHPGEILQNEIEARHLSQRAVADITGRPLIFALPFIQEQASLTGA